jgi:SAM-dependent methyltransferase
MSDNTALTEEKLSETEIFPLDLLQGQEDAFARDIKRLQARVDEFVNVPCPACGLNDNVPTLEKYNFAYVTCNKCHTLYMTPRPSPEVMDSYYSNSENYQYWAKYVFPASENARREKLHKPRLKQVWDYCQRFNISPDILVEVGPGFGTFLEVARQSKTFQRVIGIEPTPEMAQACRERGVEVIEKRIEDVTNEVQSATIVSAFEVIEHLFEPRLFLEQCRRLVKPGGLLVLTCPNGQGFDISLLGSLSWAIDPEHVNLFNPTSLSLLVEQCGFDVLEVTTPGRLDAEFVRMAIQDGTFDISHDPFLKRILIDEWERLGWPFQQFLAENGLSSHMWLVACKK